MQYIRPVTVMAIVFLIFIAITMYAEAQEGTDNLADGNSEDSQKTASGIVALSLGQLENQNLVYSLFYRTGALFNCDDRARICTQSREAES